MPPSSSIPNIREHNKLLIRLTKSICNIPGDSSNILRQLLWVAFGIETLSLLPQYAITINDQLTQTLNDLDPLADIYQGIVKFIGNKYDDA